MTSSRAERQNFFKGVAFLSPWIIGFCAFTALPIVLCIYYSFCDYSLLQAPLFRGMENYRFLLHDNEQFWKALRVTAYYAAFALPLGMVTALILALPLLQSRESGMTVRGLLLLGLLAAVPASDLAVICLIRSSAAVRTTSVSVTSCASQEVSMATRKREV